jgi:hypothetical protein
MMSYRTLACASVDSVARLMAINVSARAGDRWMLSARVD